MNSKLEYSPSGVGGISTSAVGAMIFAAGLGTRFKPWTDHNPKALAVVNGRSLLQRNIEYLQQYGIKDVVVNAHHFQDQIINAIEKNNGWGSNIFISNERDELLDTGGGLLKAKEYVQHFDDFITVNVDILTTLQIDKLIDFHRSQQSLITLAIADRKTKRFLLFDESNQLCGWRNIKDDKVIEKIVNPADTFIQKAYSGIAVFQSAVLDMIPFSGKFSLIDVYLHLTDSEKIVGYDHTGDKWIDVGRPESVPIAEDMFL